MLHYIGACVVTNCNLHPWRFKMARLI